MADDSQFGQDDELDFRPAQSPRIAKAPQAAAPDEEIDFQPHAKPATFSSVYGAPQAGTPTPTERAARLGGPSPDVSAFAPKTADLTAIPRSPFTNTLETSPGIRTEEEKQRLGSIAAPGNVRVLGPHGTQIQIPADTGTGLARALGAGAPEGSVMANLTGQRGTKDNLRLFAPEQLMTETERAQHPILTGAGEFAGSLTSPEGIMMLAGTAGAGELAGPAAQTVKQLLAAGFTAQMLADSASKVPEISDAIRRGDSYNAKRLVTHAVLSAGMAGLAGRGMLDEVPPVEAPRGSIGTPIARDFATGRADRAAQVNAQAQTGLENVDTSAAQGELQRLGGRAARRMQDFEANAAARQGVGNLADAEQGIEAAKQARINAPVDVPPVRGEPTLLRGRRLGPEPNPLAVEAAGVREQQAERKPDFDVIDMRRRLGEPDQPPPYYEIAPSTPRESKSLIARPSAADTIGPPTGRLAKLIGANRPPEGDVDFRPTGAEAQPATAAASKQQLIEQRFPSDVLDDARREIQSAADLAGTFERPGRYFSTYAQNEQPTVRTGQDKQFGGTWYGVSSSRHMVADQFPWFANIKEGADKLGELAEKGQGAAYNRVLERVATHIQNERESARPVIEQYAPHLQSLAVKIHDVDPELAQTLHELATGKAVGFKDLKGYIEGKIHDAETAARFSQAVEDAAAEARGEAGAEEASRHGGGTRAESRYNEETPGESAHPVEARGEIDFEPSQPIHPEEVEDLSRQLGRPITAEQVPEIRRRLEAERNVESGLRGNRRDVTGEIREAHRANLEQPAREEGILPGMESAVRQQREAAEREQGRQLTEQANRPPESIEGRAGTMERESPLFRGTEASPQKEIFAPRVQATRTPEHEYEDAGKKGGELASGPNPKALIEGARVLSRAWDERVARPLIDKVLKIGDKYQKAREADPAVAEGLHLLDNAPQYLRTKAAQEIHNVVGDLSRAQERLFTLMADADSRANLRANHPQEYRQAQNDPAIQEALRKYKPLEQELTAAREKMGGETLEQDYLRRVYDKYVAGVNKPSAEGKPAESAPFDRVIRPQNVNPKSREATAEYHYQNGLHEFGPAFATKFVATNLKALRDEVAHEFLEKSTVLPNGAEDPRSIEYGEKRYFRPDVAREMRDAGVKGTKEYSYYDPTQGEKFPTPAEGRYLGPKEIVKALTDYGRKEESEPSSLRRFFQEQILGFGFGVPHVFNILRRVTQQSPGGAANPLAWVNALKVGLGKELRERGLSGLNDPTFDMLAKHGAISTGEVSNLKEYIGGNLNPANWARGVAQIGHKALFEPGSFGGFGGIDQRARLYVADLMHSQRADLTDAQISRGVNDALGEYSRANWTDRQKLLGRFMMFPGWDFASLRWVLQHPIRTTVPPALVVMLSNRALHSFGQNRDEDQNDISAVHVGDRAFSTGLLRESMARNLFRPALNYAQAKVRGQSNQRALDEAARGVTSGAGGLLNLMRPDLSGFVALATNRESLLSGKEIVTKQDYETPGKILPSKALEKQAVFAVRRALPALDRMLDSNEDVDLRSFVGGNLGFPNYRDDAEKRLIRDTAEAERVYQRVGKLAKTDPEQARQFLKDPDNATYALFYRDLAGMTKMLNRIDQAKEAVEGGKLSDAEKQTRLQAIAKARGNLLTHADGLNKMLFDRRNKAASTLGLPRLGPQPVLGIHPAAGAP
jgi:hypothetical protein